MGNSPEIIHFETWELKSEHLRLKYKKVLSMDISYTTCV